MCQSDGLLNGEKISSTSDLRLDNVSDDGVSRLVAKVGEVGDTVLVEAGVVVLEPLLCHVLSGIRETLEMFSYYMRSIIGIASTSNYVLSNFTARRNTSFANPYICRAWLSA